MSQQSASKDSINDDDGEIIVRYYSRFHLIELYLDDSNDCVVCTDAKRDVVLVPW